MDNQYRLLQFTHSLDGIEVETAASGITNVSPLLRIDDDQPSRRFDDSSAYAELQWAGRVRIVQRRWWVEYGTGSRERYDGNQDAGQLWIDLHSDDQTAYDASDIAVNREARSYAPQVNNVRLGVSWIGVGREFPLRLGQAHGTGSLMFRRLSADDLRMRYLTGSVAGEDFTGMMKVIDSDGRQGEGWSLDVQSRMALGDHWLGQFTAEGVLGKISWRQTYVEDSYIVSPRVFEDPEGFLHDYYSVSGTIHYEDRSYSINPYYSLDLVRKGKPDLLLGMNWQRGIGTLPSCGAAWRQPTPWLPYMRYYPTQGRLQVGIVGPGWQFRVSSDHLTSPKCAEIALSGRSFRF